MPSRIVNWSRYFRYEIVDLNERLDAYARLSVREDKYGHARSFSEREMLDMKEWEPSAFFKVGRLLTRVQIIAGLIIFFYNFFVRDYLGVAILVYVGWLAGLVGLVFQVLGLQEFQKKGGALRGKSSLLTTVLVDSGVYAVVRHPMYLGGVLLVFGSILISQHWLTLVLGVSLLLWFFGYVLPEADKDLVEKFGDEYRHYVRRVPGMNFVVGIVRLLQRRERKA